MNLLYVQKKQGYCLVMKVIFEELIEELPIYVKQCEDNLDDILQDISPSWGINVEIINQNMRNFLFNSEWKTSCTDNFTDFVNMSILN